MTPYCTYLILVYFSFAFTYHMGLLAILLLLLLSTAHVQLEWANTVCWGAVVQSTRPPANKCPTATDTRDPLTWVAVMHDKTH
jgi:hypothetical protein